MKKTVVTAIIGLGLLLAGCAGENTAEENAADPEESVEEQTGKKGNAEQNDSSGDSQAEIGNKEETAQDDSGENESNGNGETSESRKTSEDGSMIEVEEPERIDVIVNKQRKLPEGYETPNLTVPDVPFSFEEFHPKKQMRKTAAAALEELFQAAEEDGLEPVAASGYRSYERQKAIYENSVAENGREYANRYSAKPGTSEHQTGLAMDVTSAEMGFGLDESFVNTEEGQWLKENAHRFGFVIRYPEGKSDITGYAYEPWHLRFVGKELAGKVHAENVTLEEYFGLYPVNQ
ncbi:D-alanyl-D-alanine carboxypeptidase [Salimicrobium jeotgali]|uniref:D-alanyl-D-alanine carboxypeptidase n=1 Tax=Salimicrobium jeotgali TaxID=1230341 RepID=K2GJQ1_9BACI|nr:M15 family metallopeptidase [Salimicrobium jeotgali]AKG05038.1 D-alanyl-D-alanine carboxypeptidase [Salimicrobium jeotgali]EKE30654.1 D-alanyl-D-alanine carboxypeptidase [Salimicrobium jeotgali]MBM7696889.1 D-alanyl-D-alanine carboxypeptidase [Salimicrobium jeotgali]